MSQPPSRFWVNTSRKRRFIELALSFINDALSSRGTEPPTVVIAQNTEDSTIEIKVLVPVTPRYLNDVILAVRNSLFLSRDQIIERAQNDIDALQKRLKETQDRDTKKRIDNELGSAGEALKSAQKIGYGMYAPNPDITFSDEKPFHLVPLQLPEALGGAKVFLVVDNELYLVGVLDQSSHKVAHPLRGKYR